MLNNSLSSLRRLTSESDATGIVEEDFNNNRGLWKFMLCEITTLGSLKNCTCNFKVSFGDKVMEFDYF